MSNDLTPNNVKPKLIIY